MPRKCQEDKTKNTIITGRLGSNPVVAYFVQDVLRLFQTYQHSYWYNGKAVICYESRKQTGRGEGDN